MMLAIDFRNPECVRVRPFSRSEYYLLSVLELFTPDHVTQVMNRRNLPFNALRAFEAAARHASVSGAARELSVTHSAISHQLKLLESQLGTRLFERTNRGLQITSSGESLLPVLSESFDRINDRLTDLQQNQGPAAIPDIINVTSTPSFASKWLVPRLASWYAEPEASRIHLLPSLDDLDLQAGNIDFAIRCGIPPWPDHSHELLMSIHMVPVCSPEYAATSTALKRPIDALRHNLIHADIAEQSRGQEWHDWLKGCGVDCPEQLDGLSLKDPALAMQAAADGLGLAIGYFELIDRDLNSGQLVCASAQRIKHDYSYYLLHRRAPGSGSAAARFRDWLLGQLRDG
jgi:LysR family glycine cleavage system transcriptional activator